MYVMTVTETAMLPEIMLLSAIFPEVVVYT